MADNPQTGWLLRELTLRHGELSEEQQTFWLKREQELDYQQELFRRLGLKCRLEISGHPRISGPSWTAAAKSVGFKFEQFAVMAEYDLCEVLEAKAKVLESLVMTNPRLFLGCCIDVPEQRIPKAMESALCFLPPSPSEMVEDKNVQSARDRYEWLKRMSTARGRPVGDVPDGKKIRRLRLEIPRDRYPFPKDWDTLQRAEADIPVSDESLVLIAEGLAAGLNRPIHFEQLKKHRK